MYISVNRKKIKIREVNGFKERFKSLKFDFKPLDYALKFSNARWFDTYFFVQNIDVCITNKNEVIIDLKSNVGTERWLITKKNGRNIYFLPLGTSKKLEIGDILYNYK